MALFGGSAPGGRSWEDMLAIVGAMLQDTGAAYNGRPGQSLQGLQANFRKLGDQKKYQDSLGTMFGTPSPNTVMSTPSVFEADPGSRYIAQQTAKDNDRQSMMFSGPMGQSLGYDQAAAMLPMLQNMDPNMGLPVLLSALGQAQDRNARRADSIETRGNAIGDREASYNRDRADLVMDKQMRDLSPQELQQRGLRGQWQIDRFGGLHEVKAPDTLSPEAERQRIRIAAASREPQSGAVVVPPGSQLIDRRTGQPLYKAPPKPLPASLQKEESADIEAIQTAKSISADLKAVKAQIASGALVLSPFANYSGMAMNAAGMSNQNSRNFASMKATLEKMRNDSLRLNKGVQTEGDSVRAWNELFASINDQNLVMQRLDEIDMIDQRAADLRAQQIDLRRQNYGLDPFDESQIKPRAVIGQNPANSEDAMALDWANKNPNDPRAAAIKKRLGAR